MSNGRTGCLEGRVAVVTGAGSGTGRATARRMAAEGASVVAADIVSESVKATVELIAADGGTAIAVTADVSDEASVAAMIGVAADTYGRLDVLHNNAAALGADVYGRDLDIAELDLGIWQKALSVNLTGVLLGCKHAVPAMRRSGGGAIVNMSSTAAKHGGDDHAAYGVSKSAVESLTRYVASMYGRDRIRCNAVAPGLILSETSLAALSERQLAEFNIEQALPWSAHPADIAAAVVWLASDESRCITGQTIVVDSGIMVRRPLDTLRAWERALPGLA
jgi:NAD(P)-dependent dehydrogenase (short-subunit alcohol dehydrogenase family)